MSMQISSNQESYVFKAEKTGNLKQDKAPGEPSLLVGIMNPQGKVVTVQKASGLLQLPKELLEHIAKFVATGTGPQLSKHLVKFGRVCAYLQIISRAVIASVPKISEIFNYRKEHFTKLFNTPRWVVDRSQPHTKKYVYQGQTLKTWTDPNHKPEESGVLEKILKWFSS